MSEPKTETDPVLANALTSIYAPHITPRRFMATKQGEIRGVGQIVRDHAGREYVVWSDGSWRRKDKLEAKRREREQDQS